MESIKGQTIAQTSEILSLFALPYVAEPNKQASFQDLFSVSAKIFSLILNKSDFHFD